MPVVTALRGSQISSNKRILVAGPAWVGDMVMAQSLFITLKQDDPDVEIDVLAPSWSLPLLARMPEVNQAIALPVGHGELKLAARYKIGRSLRDRHYDQAIITPRSYKSALIPFFARVPVRTGYRGEMRYGVVNDIRILDKSVLTQTVQRYVALGKSHSVVQPPQIHLPHLNIDHENQKALLLKFKLSHERPIICIMPGAEYGPAKQWPVSKYAELASKLAEQNYQVWVIGSKKEQAVGDEICRGQMNSHIINLCGKTELTDAIDLLALADFSVTNDSGLMHVACATGRSVIAIYGSSDPKYTPPLSNRAKIIYHGLECSPCFKRTCPKGHTACLNNIRVDEVIECITHP
ncbi:MAG: lipopolysaccharide heptosyltransferase II [Gammaproteobacteria bacterium]|nr:lipopolysaccharide heptosyltransferase II [Gammaproteobacteria bacterium]MDH5777450.1 lipopolysaccharide heptosyltransferase II [Gammaproteobacteria bacterium]